MANVIIEIYNKERCKNQFLRLTEHLDSLIPKPYPTINQTTVIETFLFITLISLAGKM